MGNVQAIVGTNRGSPDIESRQVREPGREAAKKRRIPDRLKNAEYRSREYLSPAETEQLISAAGTLGRHGDRDAAMLMMAYRHGLRVTELVSLRWTQIDLKRGALHVNRLKNGIASTHPLRGPELGALRTLAKDEEGSPYVFTGSRPWLSRPSAYASPRLWVQAGRRWARYPGDSALPRASEHSAHGPIHGVVAEPVQEFLA